MKAPTSLITFIALLTFSIYRPALAQQQGMIMTLKVTPKYRMETSDTLARFWSQGDLFKMWLLRTTGTFAGEGDSTGPTKSSFTPDEANKDTVKFSEKSQHMEYVRNLKTGEAIDIVYGKSEIVVWKRTEKATPIVDSTDKIWLNDQKNIAGHTCKKIVLVNRVTKLRDTIFVAMDMKKVSSPLYKFLNYLPMEFEDKANKYQVISITLANIPDTAFSTPVGSVIFTSEKEFVDYLFRKKE